jgi:hypothetical protein
VVTAYVPANPATSMQARLNKVVEPGDPYLPTDPYRNAILGGVRSQALRAPLFGHASAALIGDAAARR